jgi:hypothetical protein
MFFVCNAVHIRRWIMILLTCYVMTFKYVLIQTQIYACVIVPDLLAKWCRWLLLANFKKQNNETEAKKPCFPTPFICSGNLRSGKRRHYVARNFLASLRKCK